MPPHAGGASLYASGIEPGFAGDQLVLTLLDACRDDDPRRSAPRSSSGTTSTRSTFMMFDVFGFGRPLDHTPIMALPGVQLGTWGPPVRMVADALGVRARRDPRDLRAASSPTATLEVACGVIEAGTVGAIRMETIGVVDGRDAIVIEHVNRMAPDLAPDWPTADRDGTYRIVVEGIPSMQCELTRRRPPRPPAPTGMVATTMRIVNAIPFVCAAPPGLVSSLDLPLTLPRHAFRVTRTPAARTTRRASGGAGLR